MYAEGWAPRLLFSVLPIRCAEEKHFLIKCLLCACKAETLC